MGAGCVGRVWGRVVFLEQLDWVILFVFSVLWLLLDKPCGFSFHGHVIFHGVFLWIRYFSEIRFLTGRRRPNSKNNIQAGRFDKIEQSIENGLKFFILRSIHSLNLFLEFEKLLANVSFVDVRSKFQSQSFALNFFPVNIREPGVVFDFLEITKSHFWIRIQ